MNDCPPLLIMDHAHVSRSKLSTLQIVTAPTRESTLIENTESISRHRLPSSGGSTVEYSTLRWSRWRWGGRGAVLEAFCLFRAWQLGAGAMSLPRMSRSQSASLSLISCSSMAAPWSSCRYQSEGEGKCPPLDIEDFIATSSFQSP
jgi:hypothetical protein